jgi:hypothetical protein
VVGADGRFTCVVDPALPDGTTIEVTVTDPSGNTSAPTTTVTDGTAPAAPVVDPTDGRLVTGSGLEAGGDVRVVDASGAPVLGTVVVHPDGTFTFTPGTALTESTPVFVVGVDAARNASQPVPVPVDTTAPLAPTVDPSDGRRVTGGAVAPGDQVTLVDGSGHPIPGDLTVDDQGRFSFVPTAPLTEGQTAVVVVTDRVGNAVQVPVVIDTSRPERPVVEVTEGEKVTGCAEAGSTVTVYDSAGTAVGSAVVRADCTFEVTLEPAQAPGQSITVEVTDPAGNVSETVTIRVGAIWMRLEKESLTRGETQIAYGYGFQPGETVSAVMHSDPVELGTQVADGRGEVRFEVTIPSEVPSGPHAIALSAPFSGEVSAQFIVVDGAATPAASGPLAWTGENSGILLGLAVLLVLVGGGALVVRRGAKEVRRH